ncbi:hypothetical protein WN51_07522 [Melipona quadrifasciata]|uniref:Uncharacterized protein n=1 Tax=Melipona quadrifasciata TaxID=166423 RepID=A0A0N0BJ52_9HYME|nr:hypothetical protein WN51_07522 [Melipona quadrifasciata]
MPNPQDFVTISPITKINEPDLLQTEINPIINIKQQIFRAGPTVCVFKVIPTTESIELSRSRLNMQRPNVPLLKKEKKRKS